MPHLVEMHRKYAKDGLVAISVNLDALKEPDTGKDMSAEAKGNALRFLKSINGTMTNLLLDAPQEGWQAKFDMVGPPTIYVFDRQGRWVRFKSDDESLKVDEKTHHYPEVESLVKKLLAEKG
jgi:hypothetical protein